MLVVNKYNGLVLFLNIARITKCEYIIIYLILIVKKILLSLYISCHILLEICIIYPLQYFQVNNLNRTIILISSLLPSLI